MKKIIALLVTVLMLCSSISTSFASESAYVKSVMIDGAPKYELCVGETLRLSALAPVEGADSAYITWGADKESVVEIQHLGCSTVLSITIDSVKITALSLGEITLTAYASLDPNVDENNFEESHSIIIEVVESKFDPTIPTEIEKMYNVSYHTDVSHFNNDIEGKITSYEELVNQFSNYEEILSKYNEAFFEDKFLYRIGVLAGDPSWEMEVTDVINVEDSIRIELTPIKKQTAGAVPMVEVPWDILLEFDKIYLDKTILSIEKVTADIDTIYDAAFGQSDMVFIVIDYYPHDKVIMVGDSELYYNSQKKAYFGLVDIKDIDLAKQSVVAGKIIHTPTTFAFGNLDEDEEVDASDLQIMKLAVKGSKALEGKYLIASDVDGDGLCDTADLQAMKLKIKNNKEFPILK